MTARQIFVAGAMPSRNANGRALPAKLRFYEPDTAYSTPATVYTTSALDVAHEWPVLSDAAGRFPQIWADSAENFDVVWSDQVTDANIRAFSDIAPLSDYVGAAAAMAEQSAEEAEERAEDAQAAATRAERAAERAESAADGPNTVATSSTTMTLGLGSKTLTLEQTGKDYAEGMEVALASDADPTQRMVGTITEFADPSMTVDVTTYTGSGSASSWVISQTAVGGVQSVAGLTGVVTAEPLKDALEISSTDIADFTAAVNSLAIALAVAL